MKQMINIYENNMLKKQVEADTETIAKIVANTLPFINLTITDKFDNLILTTRGNFLDNVPDQQWLQKELMPAINSLQFP